MPALAFGVFLTSFSAVLALINFAVLNGLFIAFGITLPHPGGSGMRIGTDSEINLLKLRKF